MLLDRRSETNKWKAGLVPISLEKSRPYVNGFFDENALFFSDFQKERVIDVTINLSKINYYTGH